MNGPISPPAVCGAGRGELPAYISNGVIGLRVRDMPLRNGVAIVNGLGGDHPVTHVESSAHAPYPLGGDIRANRVWLSDVPIHISDLEQTYDFGCGELHSRFTARMDGVKARISVLTFCSRQRPMLVLQEVQVEVDQACDLTLRAVVDPGGIPGQWRSRDTGTPGEDGAVVDGSLCWETLGSRDSCGVAYATDFVGDDRVKRVRQEWGAQSPLLTDYQVQAEPGRCYRLRQIASLVPRALHGQPDRQAVRLVAQSQSAGFESLRRENRERWADLWKGRVVLVGADERWQALADAAFFYLNSSVHASSLASTSMFGLAQWYDYHYYYGHIMWDIETFSLPPLLLLQPGAARALLDFRSRTVTAARANARMNGYGGLQFPWEAGPANGEEAAPGPGTAAWHEHHVSPDVALAFARYAHATGDERFRRGQAWEVLQGVADWIVSRTTRTARGYEIKRVMGIAESQQPSDNNAYTAMIASTVLREAILCARMTGQPCPPTWQDVADHLVLPLDADRRVVVSHDGFDPSEEKGATPDPLAGIFPVGYGLDPAVEQATLEYYLRLAPEYIGSPMLSPLYGAWAARAGDRKLAARLLEEGYGRFIAGRFCQTLEYDPEKFKEQPPAGPFFANLGAFLIGCLYGFSGLEVGPGEPDSWCKRPVVMPNDWDGIEVERIWIHGKAAHLVARHGDDRAKIDVTSAT